MRAFVNIKFLLYTDEEALSLYDLACKYASNMRSIIFHNLTEMLISWGSFFFISFHGVLVSQAYNLFDYFVLQLFR